MAETNRNLNQSFWKKPLFWPVLYCSSNLTLRLPAESLKTSLLTTVGPRAYPQQTLQARGEYGPTLSQRT